MKNIILWMFTCVVISGCILNGSVKVELPVHSKQKLQAYMVKAITKRQILPDFKLPQNPSKILSLRACRGEYEPASFVATPLEGDMKIQVNATDLKSTTGVIPAEAVDIRSVKRWYQSGDQIGDGAPVNQKVHLLTPELLLKDDSLIKVDYETHKNFVRLDFPDGRQEWLWINDQNEPKRTDLSVEVRPIKDAKTLQTVAISKNTAKQFWVTVHVPQNAQAGKYKGKIELRSDNNVLETLVIHLEVLPFDLAENELESSIYFHWGNGLNPEDKATVGNRRRSAAQIKAEFENLLAHGVDNPTVGTPFKTGLLPKELQLRQEVGMKNDHLYYLAGRTSLPIETLKEIIDIAKKHGYTNVYFYGQDEARGDALKKQRAKWEQIHEIGGKIFVAGYWDNFDMMGDLQDVMVRCYQPTKEIANRWHATGHKIFSYGNPQAGFEDPEVYRRNFGLLLAVNGYDGGMDYIYYGGWNDFNGGFFRSHNMIYPTIDGVIDTIQWEGYREGIDDLRYLATLKNAIKDAERKGKDKNAEDAKAFINNLTIVGQLYWDGSGNTVISPGTDMDAVRNDIINWIIKLKRKGKS